jgi:hypothetical protein
MKIRSAVWLRIIVSLLLAGCVESFSPPSITNDIHSLVVSGYLNSTTNNASIQLSRTVPLSHIGQNPVEEKALVNIDEENGPTYLLKETAPGNYAIATLPINNARRYRLRVQTSDNKQYQSDYVPINISPPIDSVGWARSLNNDGVEIHVSTHDDTGLSRYYHWTYEETWEYTAVYESEFIILSTTQVGGRPPNASIFTCWSGATSQQILVAASERLNQDIISRKKLLVIPGRSQKLFRLYTILVKQHTLTRDAYQYFSQLQKTNEGLGGLFDPQPGSVVGNIHNINDPFEPVMGYFMGGTIQERRLWIDVGELPNDLKGKINFENCYTRKIGVDSLYLIMNAEIVGTIAGEMQTNGYIYTTKDCADCRTQGGETAKPFFWPY